MVLLDGVYVTINTSQSGQQHNKRKNKAPGKGEKPAGKQTHKKSPERGVSTVHVVIVAVLLSQFCYGGGRGDIRFS
jgi:hypothetical protein